MQRPMAGHQFDLHLFLRTNGYGARTMILGKGAAVFTQGDSSNGIFWITKGKVQLTVVSESGKEATLGILGNGDFLGEDSLAGQLLRTSSAISMTDCVLLHIETQPMMQAMRTEPELAMVLLNYLVKRNIRYQEDLVDQLFNFSEKRLARLLLMMARSGEDGLSEMVLPQISQQALAKMVGTTRSRISFFMNRFRKLGLIDYSSGKGDMLRVHSSLLNVILRDDGGITGRSRTQRTMGADGKDPYDSQSQRDEALTRERDERSPHRIPAGWRPS